jgi:hypothetical protein
MKRFRLMLWDLASWAFLAAVFTAVLVGARYVKDAGPTNGFERWWAKNVEYRVNGRNVGGTVWCGGPGVGPSALFSAPSRSQQ